MKKSSWPKFTSEIYKEAGYSDEIITNIKWWESQHPSVDVMLLEYRYVQPDGELFSEHSLKIIIALYDMKYMLEKQKELICAIESSFQNLIQWTFKQRSKSSDDFFFDKDPF